MTQAGDNNIEKLRSGNSVDRRSMLATIVGGVVAASMPEQAEKPSAIAVHFAILERMRNRLRRTERILNTCLRNYETVAPRWPDSLKYVEKNTGWKFYCRRAETVERDDENGVRIRYLGSKAISHAIDRLLSMTDDDAPIVSEAREHFLLAKKIEDAEDEAGRLSGFDHFEREFDAVATTVGDIGDTILAIEPKSADDLRMQARVLRDSNRGYPKDEATIRFLNFVMTSRFDI